MAHHHSINDFGKFLVAEKLATEDQKKVLFKKYEDIGCGLSELIISSGILSEEKLAGAVAEFTQSRLAKTNDYPVKPIKPTGWDTSFFHLHQVVPCLSDDDQTNIIISAPLSDISMNALIFLFGRSFEIKVGTFSEINSCLNRVLCDHDTKAEETTTDSPTDLTEERLAELALTAPTIRFLNQLIASAVELRASDIHLRPNNKKLEVKLRIDGCMEVVSDLPSVSPAAVISRVKILASLNIAEQRLPQDGRFQLNIDGRHVDIRASILPQSEGERVVLRLLDQQNAFPHLENIGFEDDDIIRIRKFLSASHGLILLVGPTGSGKTTTLYSALNEIDDRNRNILTVEDPIEYQLAGISQMQVKPEIGLSFAQALRAILRQDPDVIMVGEIRDKETAQIAIHAALTGHLVFSTLHTNSAAGAIERLLDLGCEEYLIASALIGIVSQRLVRKLCHSCREVEETSTLKSFARGNIERGAFSLLQAFREKGCEKCRHTGFRGRLAIAEVLHVDARIAEAISSRLSADEIFQIAVDAGMRSLFRDGLLKVEQGVTSLDEIGAFAAMEIACE